MTEEPLVDQARHAANGVAAAPSPARADTRERLAGGPLPPEADPAGLSAPRHAAWVLGVAYQALADRRGARSLAAGAIGGPLITAAFWRAARHGIRARRSRTSSAQRR